MVRSNQTRTRTNGKRNSECERQRVELSRDGRNKIQGVLFRSIGQRKENFIQKKATLRETFDRMKNLLGPLGCNNFRSRNVALRRK